MAVTKCSARYGIGDKELEDTGGALMGRDEQEVEVQLKKGLHHVSIKTTDIGGGWGACLYIN